VSLKTVVEANAEWGPSLEITTIISSGASEGANLWQKQHLADGLYDWVAAGFGGAKKRVKACGIPFVRGAGSRRSRARKNGKGRSKKPRPFLRSVEMNSSKPI
jgi:hypothetical protein